MKRKRVVSISSKLLSIIAIGVIMASSVACDAKDLMKDGAPGSYCVIEYGNPYRFENIGTEPLTIIYDRATKKFTVRGKVKLLPTGKVYEDKEFTLAIDEGSMARAIDAVKQLDWGSLPKNEIGRAEKHLKFCRAVAQYEAKKPVTEWETFEGEPAMAMFSTDGSMKGSRGVMGSDMRFEYVGPGSVKFLQLKPSGRFRVEGCVKCVQTGQVCTNGLFNKDGKVIPTEK